MATEGCSGNPMLLIAIIIAVVAGRVVNAGVENTQISSDNSQVALGDDFGLTAGVSFAAGTETLCIVTISSEYVTLNVSNIDLGNVTTTSTPTESYSDDRTEVVISLGSLDNSGSLSIEDITIELDATMTFSAAMKENFTIEITAEYGAGYASTLSSETTVMFTGPEVTSSYTTDEDVTYGSVPFDKEQEALVNIVLPQSTLTSVSLIMVFASPDMDSIPVNVSGAYCSFNSSLYNITVPSLNITNYSIETDDYSGLARRKRSTGSQTTITWNVGDITNNDNGNAELSIAMFYFLKQTADTFLGQQLDYGLYMEFNGKRATLEQIFDMQVSEPDLDVYATSEALFQQYQRGDYVMDVIRFNVTVSHSVSSLATAHSVVLSYPMYGLEILLYDDMQPPFYVTPGYTVVDSVITWTVSNLQIGQTMFLSFKAFFNRNSLLLNTGLSSIYTAEVTYDSLPASSVTLEFPGKSYVVSDTACITKVEETEFSYLYNAGAGALAFFLALIIAAILVALLLLLWIKVLKKSVPFATIEPDFKASSSRRGTRQGLIMSSKDAYKAGFNTIKESSLIAIDESIIHILILKDRLQVHRELDNLDVLSTITVDIELEIQRVEMMTEAVIILIQSLRMNKDITKDVEDKTINKFQRNLKDLNKRLSDEYKQESAKLIKRLSAQNKGRLAKLHKKQAAERRNIKVQTETVPKEERKEILDLIEKQHTAEENELTHLLKLEQDEEQEKLRKEFAIHKRMAVKTLQHSLLDDVKTQGKLTEEQANWLMKQHKKNMSQIEKFMDDEISRQRMVLDEKLARRRALADSKESQDDHHSDLLNTMASQQIDVIKTLVKSEKLTDEEAEQYMERIKRDLVAMKQKFDAEQKKQEDNLHKRLSELKKRRIEQKEREHKQELAEFEKKQKVKAQNSNIDPLGYVEGKEHLLSQQRSEMNELENSLDEEAAKELEQMREQRVTKVKTDIKNSGEKLYKELANKGLDEEMKDEIFAQHERDLEKLQEAREEEKAKHEKILKKRLAKNRKEWAKRKEAEKEEQQKIREHEDQMIGRLIATQVVMSDADRDKILQEHEKQLVKLENSLTLNKLRQKRKLEEKLAAKKSKQMEKLEKKHNQESQRQKRRQEVADTDTEEDFGQAKLDLMKRHAEEKIAALTSERAKTEDELEQVRVEMLEERAKALKDQEERLGAMVAKLQMEKARELATIEDQQKALNNLKMNMMDELTDKGLLSNPEGKKIIDEHQKEVEKLEGKLTAQRQKQEKDLKKRLRERVAQREKSFVALQEEEMRQLYERETNKVAAKIKLAAKKHKQMLELEEFRRNMEVEIGQALEDLRRSYEVKRLQLMQEQEIEFLSGLIKHGDYKRSELQGILLMLFPNKSDKQVNALLDKMYRRDAGDTEEDEDETASRTKKQKKPKKGGLMSRILQDGGHSSTGGKSEADPHTGYSRYPDSEEDERVIEGQEAEEGQTGSA
ncbi:limbin-like isoform X2 [Ptychodera flava]|uniref:limbin-like isoform X2 n=1 Tax=Ptychodera flava TaxID=63121 RepID=UPI00396A24F2